MASQHTYNPEQRGDPDGMYCERCQRWVTDESAQCPGAPDNDRVYDTTGSHVVDQQRQQQRSFEVQVRHLRDSHECHVVYRLEGVDYHGIPLSLAVPELDLQPGRRYRITVEEAEGSAPAPCLQALRAGVRCGW